MVVSVCSYAIAVGCVEDGGWIRGVVRVIVATVVDCVHIVGVDICHVVCRVYVCVGSVADCLHDVRAGCGVGSYCGIWWCCRIRG